MGAQGTSVKPPAHRGASSELRPGCSGLCPVHPLLISGFFLLQSKGKARHEKKLYWFRLRNHLGHDLIPSRSPQAGLSSAAFVHALRAWPQVASPDALVLHWEEGWSICLWPSHTFLYLLITPFYTTKDDNARTFSFPLLDFSLPSFV